MQTHGDWLLPDRPNYPPWLQHHVIKEAVVATPLCFLHWS